MRKPSLTSLRKISIGSLESVSEDSLEQAEGRAKRKSAWFGRGRSPAGIKSPTSMGSINSIVDAVNSPPMSPGHGSEEWELYPVGGST